MEKQKKWSRIMIGAVLVLILVIGGTAVLAQSQDEPDVTPPVEEGDTDSTVPAFPRPFSRGEGQRPNFGERGLSGKPDGDAGEALAEALGITVEELGAAQDAAHAAALEQAVADGLLTQEQADRLSQFDGRGKRGGHFSAFGEMDELLAAELGISVEALQSAIEEVQAAKLAQLIEDGVLTQEQADLMAARRAVNEYVDHEGLCDAAQAAYETAVQQALDAGEITQAQADQLLSDAATAPGFDRFGGRGGRGGHGHGGHGFPGGMPGSTNTPTTTADSDT